MTLKKTTKEHIKVHLDAQLIQRARVLQKRNITKQANREDPTPK